MQRRSAFGHVINISSMSGHRVPDGASGGAFYSATKYALRALTEGLRQEVCPPPLLHASPRAPVPPRNAAWSGAGPLCSSGGARPIRNDPLSHLVA